MVIHYKFAYNNHIQRSIGISPRECDLCYRSTIPLDAIVGAVITKHKAVRREKAENFMYNLNCTLTQDKDIPLEAQTRHEAAATTRTEPSLAAGDEVLLSMAHLPSTYANTDVDSNKLRNRFAGPITVDWVKGNLM